MGSRLFSDADLPTPNREHVIEHVDVGITFRENLLGD
jgi:hypothetical protein